MSPAGLRSVATIVSPASRATEYLSERVLTTALALSRKPPIESPDVSVPLTVLVASERPVTRPVLPQTVGPDSTVRLATRAHSVVPCATEPTGHLVQAPNWIPSQLWKPEMPLARQARWSGSQFEEVVLKWKAPGQPPALGARTTVRTRRKPRSP